MSLTTADIKRVKPGRQVYEIHDRGGLVLRVWPSGALTWCVRFRDAGADRRKTVGRWPDMGPEQARAACRRLRNAAAGRQDPTVRRLAREYLENVARPRKRSWRYDQQLLERHILETRVVPKDRRKAVHFGDIALHQLTRHECMQVIAPIERRGCPDMASRVHACLRHVLEYGVRLDWLQGNPASRAGIRQSPPRQRILEPGEFAAWWPHLQHAPPAPRIALLLVISTCQRLGEVLSMAPTELDPIEHRWSIPESKAKNGRRHVVPLSGLARDLIEQAQLLPHPERYRRRVLPVSDDTVREWMTRTIAAAGLEDRATPHDLRRTGATWLADLGVSRTVQNKLLNHVDQSVGGIYDLYAYMEERRAAVDALAERLLTLMQTDQKHCPAHVLPDGTDSEATRPHGDSDKHKG